MAATLLATFSPFCSGWKVSKIVQPYQEAFHTSRVDLMDIGCSTNSIIEEIATSRGSWYSVNSQRMDTTSIDWLQQRQQQNPEMSHKPRVAWIILLGRYWDGANKTRTVPKASCEKKTAGRRKERRLIPNCTAHVRILRCLGTHIVWEWPQKTHGWTDHSMQKALEMMPYHVRIDTCMCGMCETTHGSLVWKPRRV